MVGYDSFNFMAYLILKVGKSPYAACWIRQTIVGQAVANEKLMSLPSNSKSRARNSSLPKSMLVRCKCCSPKTGLELKAVSRTWIHVRWVCKGRFRNMIHVRWVYKRCFWKYDPCPIIPTDSSYVARPSPHGPQISRRQALHMTTAEPCIPKPDVPPSSATKPHWQASSHPGAGSRYHQTESTGPCIHAIYWPLL